MDWRENQKAVYMGKRKW